MRSKAICSAALIFSMMVLAGCGPKADARKPVEQVQAEAAGMKVSQLESAAKAYARAVQAKRGELEKVTEELKKLPPKDLLSEKSHAIRERASALGTEAGELIKRYDIYARRLKELGGDVSKVKIPE